MKEGLALRPIAIFSLIMAALLLGAGAPPPRGVEGDWRNSRNTIHLRVAPCGDTLCATVIWASAVAQADAKKGSGKDLIGSQLVTGLRQQRDGRWRGRAYVPDINIRGSATVTQLNPNQLRVSGCVIAGIVCQTRHWHRIS